jgi:hypothetical protein
MSRSLRLTALASADALGVVPIAAAASADAAPANKKPKAPSEKTDLPVCAPSAGTLASPQFFGTKVTVGFFHGVKETPAVNKAKQGRVEVLEYRVEDIDAGCVRPDPLDGVLSVNRVDCATLTSIESLDGVTPVFEQREKHFRAEWTVPAGRGQCYLLTSRDISAVYRTK